jgi:hypothetical protein
LCAWLCLALPANVLADYRVGDAAKTGIATPLALALVSTIALLAAARRWSKSKPRSAGSAAQVSARFPDAPQAGLAPQVSPLLREALHQELSSQRRDLLLAQRAATGEIVALVERLDELQAPVQERLLAYEGRIQRLEKELALRQEENRQLLTLQIEMVNHQLETERTGTSAPSPNF